MTDSALRRGATCCMPARLAVPAVIDDARASRSAFSGSWCRAEMRVGISGSSLFSGTASGQLGFSARVGFSSGALCSAVVVGLLIGSHFSTQLLVGERSPRTPLVMGLLMVPFIAGFGSGARHL